MRVRSLVFCAAFAAAAALPAAAEEHYGRAETLPPSVPVGWALAQEVPVASGTSLSFAPDGSWLYVALQPGRVLSFPVVYGAVVPQPSVFLEIRQPLGVLATPGAVFVAGIDALGQGIVERTRDTNGDGVADVRETVISKLPNGRHNTNGLAIGPDGLLYIANGNSTDSGFGSEGGGPEKRPYSGSVLRVDPAATGLVPDPSMVVATGFRNIFDIAFFPGTSIAAVPTNGPDGVRYGTKQRPAGEDVLAVFETADDAIEHFLFPWCLHDRTKGGVAGFPQDATVWSDCASLPPEALTGLEDRSVTVAQSATLIGMHVSADGLAFDPASGDLFIAEWGNLYGQTTVGHKVVRVAFDPERTVTSVTDFSTGGTPLDLTFAPDGSLWVADFGLGLYRFVPVL